MMSKRCCQDVTRAIADEAENSLWKDWPVIARTAERIADVFAKNSPYFDRDQFLVTAGFSER